MRPASRRNGSAARASASPAAPTRFCATSWPNACSACRRTFASTRTSRSTSLESRDLTMNRLDGKVAFLSGAARGIGAATAKLMAEAGAMVVIGDMLDEVGRKTAKEINALYVHLDVTSEASWAEA